MLLAGVLLLLGSQVGSQPARTVVVRDSEEFASALRNASSASQTSPTATTIYLNLLSSEVETNPRYRLACLLSYSRLSASATVSYFAGCAECGFLCH